MLWLLSTFALAWDLNDVRDFCKDPPDTSSRSWEDTVFGYIEGRGTTVSEKYFHNSYGVHVFQNNNYRIVGIMVDADKYQMTLRKVNHQINSHYNFFDDGFQKYFRLNSQRDYPDYVMFMQDADHDVLMLASCNTYK